MAGGEIKSQTFKPLSYLGIPCLSILRHTDSLGAAPGTLSRVVQQVINEEPPLLLGSTAHFPHLRKY